MFMTFMGVDHTAWRRLHGVYIGNHQLPPIGLELLLPKAAKLVCMHKTFLAWPSTDEHHHVQGHSANQNCLEGPETSEASCQTQLPTFLCSSVLISPLNRSSGMSSVMICAWQPRVISEEYKMSVYLSLYFSADDASDHIFRYFLCVDLRFAAKRLVRKS